MSMHLRFLVCISIVACGEGAAHDDHAAGADAVSAGRAGALAALGGVGGAATQAGADAPTSGGATGGSQPALDPSKPSYEVPVPDALKVYAQYAVGPVEWTAKQGARKLEYDLPADLIGNEQRLELTGPDSSTGPWTLRGDTFGTALCELTAGQVVCHEALAGLPIDVAAVAARVQRGELPPQRLEVTKVFNGDPLGILRFPAP